MSLSAPEQYTKTAPSVKKRLRGRFDLRGLI